MSPLGATVIAVGLNFVSLSPDSSGNGSFRTISPVRALNLIPSGVVVAGAVEELAVRFVADLQVVDVGIAVAEEAPDDLALGREDEDAGMGARVDVAVLVDDDPAVARPDHGLPVRAEAPARHPCRTSSDRTPFARAERFPLPGPAKRVQETRVRARATKVGRCVTIRTPRCDRMGGNRRGYQSPPPRKSWSMFGVCPPSTASASFGLLPFPFGRRSQKRPGCRYPLAHPSGLTLRSFGSRRVMVAGVSGRKT